MAKVTERTLKEQCQAANADVLKEWPFGLKAERYRDGFMVYRLFRKGCRQERLLDEPLAARETFVFIAGFVQAAALANEGGGSVPDRCIAMVEAQAAGVREANSYRGRVNQAGDFAATILDRLAAAIKEVFQRN